MSGVFAAHRPFGRTALAIGLCLLAFFFALEAKLAWYGPQSGPDGDVHAVKALPVDTPDIVSEDVPAPDPVHPHLSFALLAPLIAVGMADTDTLLGHAIVQRNFSVSSAAYFSPNSFFRPPPVR